MNTIKLIIFLLLITSLFASAQKAQKLLKNGTPAPGFMLSAVKGGEIGTGDIKGNITVIDFFYKSCQPCILAMPGLQDLYDRYFKKGVNIIGIDADDDGPVLASFLNYKGVNYPVLLGTKDLEDAFHVSYYPTIYILDKNGNIIFSEYGYDNDLDKKIEKVILKNL
jgi:thiol-disulfide isomerase/thioredoxin